MFILLREMRETRSPVGERSESGICPRSLVREYLTSPREKSEEGRRTYHRILSITNTILLVWNNDTLSIAYYLSLLRRVSLSVNVIRVSTVRCTSLTKNIKHFYRNDSIQYMYTKLNKRFWLLMIWRCKGKKNIIKPFCWFTKLVWETCNHLCGELLNRIMYVSFLL